MSKIKNINLDGIASEDFLNYATEVIKQRAIPNIEDNLKPVHRRILYTMYRTKLTSDKKEKKSAATVGEVMKIHPHGDSSIYDALIRLAQDWKMRYPLISVQGNKGNINGSPAAAMRYTEAKLSPIGDLMVNELKESSVGMMETYDGESIEPITMPSAFPNILCNGNMGIAVGMSSSILPHNLKEIVAGLLLMIENEAITLEEIMKVVPGPDFPTGGTVINAKDIFEVYSKGSGSISLQAKYQIEKKGRASHIVITEVPYLVDIEKIIVKIKTLSKEGRIEDVIDIQNNTGRSGTELRIILRPKADVNRTLQILLNDGGLKTSVRVGMTVLENFKPIQTNFLGLMKGYLNHRHDVLINIYTERKEKAEKRNHILSGLILAAQDIDNAIALIKASSNRADARNSLMRKYSLDEEQANAILDMRLSRLTKIDTLELVAEKEKLEKDIINYSLIIENKTKRNDIIVNDLTEINKNFGDSRRTILKNVEIEEIKRPETDYILGLFNGNEIGVIEASKIWTGSKNRIGKKIFDNVPKQIIQFNSGNSLLVFDDEGKVLEISGSRISEGNHLFYDLDSRVKENIVFIAEINEEAKKKEYLVTITKNNLIKKTSLEEYNNFRSMIFAAKMREKDSIVYAGIFNDDEYVIVLGDNYVNKYELSSIRATGRSTQGVKASGYDTVLAATIGKNQDKLVLLDKEGSVKAFLIQDIQEGNRNIKGTSTSPKNYDLCKVQKGSVVLYGDDNKGYLLDASEFETKTLKNSNIKIYNGKLSKIGV